MGASPLSLFVFGPFFGGANLFPPYVKAHPRRGNDLTTPMNAGRIRRCQTFRGIATLGIDLRKHTGQRHCGRAAATSHAPVPSLGSSGVARSFPSMLASSLFEPGETPA